MPKTTRKEWLESYRDGYELLPLDTARAAFGWLVTGPEPLGVDGRRFEVLPDRHVPLDELRDLLMRSAVPDEVRDAIWTYLVECSRCEGGAWTVACVGMAMPSLAARARWLGARYRGERADVHAALLTGFVGALATIELTGPAVMMRLIWRAWEDGKAALSESLDAPLPVEADEFHSVASRPPYSHPDLVLARAVGDGVLTPTEAELISATRLGDVSMGEWTKIRGVALKTGFKARDRAEDRLVSWLREQPSGSDSGDPAGDAATGASGPTADVTPTDLQQPLAVSGRRRNGRPSTAKKSPPSVSKTAPDSSLVGCGESGSVSPHTAVAREMPEVRRCA